MADSKSSSRDAGHHDPKTKAAEPLKDVEKSECADKGKADEKKNAGAQGTAGQTVEPTPKTASDIHTPTDNDVTDTAQKKRKAEASDTNKPDLDVQGPSKKTRSKSPPPKKAEDDETATVHHSEENFDDPAHYWNRHPLSPLRCDDKQKWPGFHEVETDPAEFTSMLRLLGVKGLEAFEVVGLDLDTLLSLPPIYGFILCFRHREDDDTKQVANCPSDIWFANQTHALLCGSNALLNIINNIPDVDLGEHMSSFKEFTKDFTPFLRGEAVGNFDFLRRVHNSGLRKMDLLLGDVALMEKYERRRKRPPTAPKPKAEGKGKKQANPKEKAPVTKENKFSEDTAYHYAAYLPIKGHVWKLDGLERQPMKLDAYADEGWFITASEILQSRMAEVAGEQNYSLLAIGREENKPGSPTEEEQKSKRSHYDYEPVVRQWLQMLANKEGLIKEMVGMVVDLE